MGSAKYIGRVGALAVALGIGTAITIPTAGAAPADSNSSTSSSTDSPSSARTSHDPHTHRHAQRTQSAAPAEPVTVAVPAKSKHKASPTRQHNRAEVSPKPTAIDTPAVQAVVKRAEPVAATAAPTAAPASSPVAVAATNAVSTAGTVTARAVATTAVASQSDSTSSSSAASAVLTAVSSSLNTGTGVPADSPANWVMLAAARREVGVDTTANAVAAVAAVAPTAAVPAATTPNQAPVIGVPVFGAPNAATGAVSGQVVATDPEGKALTYTLTSAPATGTLTFNKKTGAFTYTPTPAQRIEAGLSSDQVTVDVGFTVSDGKLKTPTVVSVPIAPTTVVGLQTISTGSLGVAITSTNDRVYVSNPLTNTISVIDSIQGAVIGTIATGGAPTGLAVTPDGKKLYVASSGVNGIAVYDTATSTLKKTINFTGKLPTTMAMSPTGAYLYVGTVSVDKTGQPSLDSNGNYKPGAVVKIAVSSNSVAGTITKVGAVPMNMVISPDGKKIYVTAQEVNVTTGVASSNAYVFSSSATTGKLIGSLGTTPILLALNGNGSQLYVTAADSTVHVVETTHYTEIGTADLGITPTTLSTSRDGSLLLAADSSGAITVFDTNTFTPIGAVENDGSGTQFSRMVTSPDGMQVYALGNSYSLDDSSYHSMVQVISLVGPNQAPTAGPVTLNAPTSTGVVAGDLHASDPDGNALSYTASKPSKGTVTVNGDGTFTYTPTAVARHAASADGADAGLTTDGFTVTISDGLRGIVTVPVTVDIDPANIAPVVSKVTVGKPSSTGKVTGTITVKDADKDKLTFPGTIVTDQGTVVVNTKGQYTFTPTADARHAAATGDPAAGQLTFTVDISDGHGGTVTTAPITVKISPSNTKPTVKVGTNTTDAVTGIVSTQLTATDTNGDTVSYIGGSTSKGSFTVSATGLVTYTPTQAARDAASAPKASSTTKADSFKVAYTDGHGGTGTVTVKVTIAPNPPYHPNSAPVFGTPTFTTGADGVVTGNLKVTDADNDPLTFNQTNVPTMGSAVINPDGTFTYTPTAEARHASAGNYYGLTDSFTVEASDGRGGTAITTVSVPVSPQNTAPVLSITSGQPDPATGKVTGTAIASDADGDTTEVYVETYPTKGSVSFVDGAFTYTPTSSARRLAATGDPAAQTDSFTIGAVDSHLNGATYQTVTVTVAPLPNHAPTASSPSINQPAANGVITGTVYASDADGDNVTYSQTSIPTMGSVVVTTAGSFTYTPTAQARHDAAANPTTDSFTITASDGYGGSVSIPVTVTVAPSNAFPGNATATTNPPTANGVVTGSVTATDADGDALTYTATTPTKGSLSLGSNGTFTYTPTAAARHDAATDDAPLSDKTDSFTVTINDGHGGTVAVPVTITITPTNSAPHITNATAGSPVNDGTVTGTISATDPDNDNITYTATAANGLVTVRTDGTFTYTPTDDARNTAAGTPGIDLDTITFTADDGHGGTDSQNVSVTIAPDYLPAITNTTIGAPNTTTGVVTGSVTATDPDGETITYTAWPSAKGTVTIDGATGQFTYTPTASARLAASQYGATAFDKQDMFVVDAVDSRGGSTATVVTVTVQPVAGTAGDHAPVAGTTTLGTPDPTTGAITGSVAFTDPDGDALTYSVSGSPAKGSITVNSATGAFTYTPVDNAYVQNRHKAAADNATVADKTDTFKIFAADFRGQTSEVTVTVTVTPSNSVPTANIQRYTKAAADGTVTGYTSLFSDSNGDTLTYSTVGPSKGTVTISSTGYFTYTPTAAARQQAAAPGATLADLSDSFTVTANDAHGGIATTTLTVAVLPTGATPGYSSNNLTYTITDRDPATGTTTGTARLYFGTAATFIVTGQPAKGTITVDPTSGVFVYTPNAQARHDAATVGTDPHDTFTITGVTAQGTTGSWAITVPIGMANTAPELINSTVGTPNTTTGVVTGQISATDPDGDTITYVGPGITDKGSVTVDSATGAFTYTPANAARAFAALTTATAADLVDTFTITAYDNHGSYAQSTVTVAISPSSVNTPLAQTTPTTIGSPDPTTGAVTGNFNLLDLDRDNITYTIVPIAGSTSADGIFSVMSGDVTIDGATGAWTFIPTVERLHEASQEVGGRPDNYAFRWTATDARGSTVTGEVAVPIVPINHVPTVANVGQTRNATTGIVTGTYSMSDSDGDTITLNGPASVSGGGTLTTQWLGGTTYQWIYTPPASNLNNAPSFTITWNDGHGGNGYSLTGVWSGATATTDNPVFTGLKGNSSDSSADPTTGAVSGTVTPPSAPGHTLTYSATGVTKGAIVVDSTTGAYTFTPDETARQNAAANGAPTSTLTDSFTETVTDELGNVVKVIPINVPISPLNRRPTTQVTIQPPDENGDVKGTITAIDPDGDTYTFSAPATSRLGQPITFSSGSFTYSAGPAMRTYATEHPGTVDYFVITVTEAQGQKTYVPVTITVPPIMSVSGPGIPNAPVTPNYPPQPGGPSSNPAPAGPKQDDVLNDPHRLTAPIPGLQTTKTQIYKTGDLLPDPTVSAIETHYSVTVTNPSSNSPLGYGDIYVLQLDHGVVTGYAKLPPGTSITGEEVVERDFGVTGTCGGTGCFVTLKQLQVVAFAPGYFPGDLWPVEPPPITVPLPVPYDGYLPEAEQGIKDIMTVQLIVKCIAGATAVTGAYITSYVPTTGSTGSAIKDVIEVSVDAAAKQVGPSVMQAAIEAAKMTNCSSSS